MPLYPGTGARFEGGTGPGAGATINRPLPPGAGDEEFLGVLREDLVEAADAFGPDFVLVSAGFDAHADDPLAGLAVSTEGYAEATHVVADIADRHAAGRLVSMLEGGYDLDALAASTEAHVRALLGD
jgi:acetoin utilization deacetylase AcuC-like enzyme